MAAGRKLVAAAGIALVGAAMLVVTSDGVRADPGPQQYAGMPNQDFADLISTDPMKGGNAGWADMPGGVEDRPYVSALSVTNGATVTQVIANGGTSRPATATGDVTAVVSPYNLCRVDQVPAPGSCYATPNRVGVTVTYDAGDTDGYDFARTGSPEGPLTTSPVVDAASVIDMTVRLNSLGRKLRWSWVNGDLLYWRTTNLGQDDATVRVRFRPASAPVPASWPDGNGCTATPIFNCDIAQAASEYLGASLLFSLDATLDPALTGAVFATRNAIAGFLQPGGTPDAPTLDIQAASTHLKSDGSLQKGTLQAFLPAAGLVNLYGVLPADAGSAFSTTRSGDPGSNLTPTYTTWNAAQHGADGLLVTVRDITFSVPKYRVKGKVKPIGTGAKVRGTTTTVAATLPVCTRRKPCTATVYDLGRATSARFTSTRRLVVNKARVTGRAMALRTTKAKLPKGNRYLLVVRSGTKLVTSSLGKVS